MSRPGTTVYLGQYTWEHANQIAEALEEAGIGWWYKSPGTVAHVLFSEWGIRLFVEHARLDEAKEIASRFSDV